jgi:hypothetical protein
MATKINKMLQILPKDAILTSQWLGRQGYNSGLLRRYRSSEWLVSIGTGAMIRTGEQPTIWGGIHALQMQLGLPVYPAGKTALELLGRSHFLAMGNQVLCLIGYGKVQLPEWFKKYPWEQSLTYHTTSIISSEEGLETISHQGLELRISGAARAMMECLHLAHSEEDLIESYELMAGLNNLDPDTVWKLLSDCSSVKVKRLFLYLAEKSRHPWFDHLNLNQIDLGTGNRSLAEGGVYIPAYKLIVPSALAGRESITI